MGESTRTSIGGKGMEKKEEIGGQWPRRPTMIAAARGSDVQENEEGRGMGRPTRGMEERD